MHEIKIRYSEPLLREAVRAFCFRAIKQSLGRLYFFALALLGICAGSMLIQGDRSWVVGALCAVLFFASLAMFGVYFAHHRNTIGRFRQMRVPEATLAYDEEQFTFTSEFGSTSLPWSSIVNVWRYPGFWLLLFSPSQFTTLPIDCLDAETQEFITRKTAGRSGTPKK